MPVNGVIALLIAYLLGSIPAAYIAARLVKGKDIRQMGWGNVGAGNTFREVGKVAGIAVGIIDVGKGAAAVAIAHWLLDAPQLFLLAAGIAAVAGHIWSIYLKFTGGRGLATALGVLSVLMPWELLIVFAITIILIVITRNPVLSVNLSLLSVPVSAWFLEQSWLLVIFPIVLMLILALNFLPRAIEDSVEAGGIGNYVAELLRMGRANKKET